MWQTGLSCFSETDTVCSYFTSLINYLLIAISSSLSFKGYRFRLWFTDVRLFSTKFAWHQVHCLSGGDFRDKNLFTPVFPRPKGASVRNSAKANYTRFIYSDYGCNNFRHDYSKVSDPFLFYCRLFGFVSPNRIFDESKWPTSRKSFSKNLQTTTNKSYCFFGEKRTRNIHLSNCYRCCNGQMVGFFYLKKDLWFFGLRCTSTSIFLVVWDNYFFFLLILKPVKNLVNMQFTSSIYQYF